MLILYDLLKHWVAEGDASDINDFIGRYGDSLNPWGDLITMAQAWCLLKPGARALVGLPSEFSKAEKNCCCNFWHD